MKSRVRGRETEIETETERERKARYGRVREIGNWPTK